MKTIRFIIGLVITIFSLGASAQTYYYFGEKKVPLKLLPHIKVILCEDTVKTPIHLDKGDSLIRKIYPENSIAYVYREGENSQTYKRYSANPSAKVSVYPGYRDDTGDLVAPTGCLETILKRVADTTLLKEVCKQYDCVISSRSDYHPTWYTIRMKPRPGRNPVLLANTLYEKGYFEDVGPEFWMPNMFHISYDPETTKQWALYNAKDNVDISVSEAWNYATGRGIKIGVVDSGFDIEQEDLKQRISDSYDAETKTSPCKKITEHGTRCAGIAAATRNNNKGIAGVAPDSELLLGSMATGDSVNTKIVAHAIDWCRAKGADVISCSFSLFKSRYVERAIKAAIDSGRNGKGCIFVAAAGNIGSVDTITPAILYPASDSLVIAVGNINKQGLISYSSRYGPNMWVVAPGTNIISPIPRNKYTEASGTSLACPHVAGVAALILQRNPSLTWKEVRDIIKNTATKVGPLSDETPWDDHYGYGLVNACEAVKNTPRPKGISVLPAY